MAFDTSPPAIIFSTLASIFNNKHSLNCEGEE
ncbi:hypothetical protein Gotur_021935 [Gossypium turneri]